MNLRLHNNYYSLFKKRNKTIKKGLFKIQKPPAHKEFRALHLVLFLSFLYAGMSSANAQTIRYVKVGATGTGTTWANASGDLQMMINASLANDVVWVAGGVYTAPLNGSFSMKEGVQIYGGFAGTETSLSQRNWQTNIVTLKGNGTHVIKSSNLTATAALDGFTVIGGSGSGGGMYNNTFGEFGSRCRRRRYVQFHFHTNHYQLYIFGEFGRCLWWWYVQCYFLTNHY